MTRYKCDPRWITFKFKGSACLRCKRPIHPGERAFYYPEERSLCCDGERYGKAASRGFAALASDEDNNRCLRGFGNQ